MSFSSYNPATGDVIWKGLSANAENIQSKIDLAKKALGSTDRIPLMLEYAKKLEANKDQLAHSISKETGKPLWDSRTEVAAMIAKIPISIEAFKERCSPKQISNELRVDFRPHGVVAVFGPFNFPGHLPNGHIVPALLAGNAVIFKPSELTPSVGELMKQLLPTDLFQVVQGGPDVGKMLAASKEIQGIFFTGSAFVGEQLKMRNPEKILALEMGGNNPLVISSISDVKAAAQLTIRSAFLTTGQRCSAARRLIITPECPKDFLKELIEHIEALKIGAYNDLEEPFMGPLIDMTAANKILKAQEALIKLGGKILYPMKLLKKGLPFVTPALIDVTEIQAHDEEYFGPLLQVIYAKSLEHAIGIGNNTAYGLSAGLFSDSKKEWDLFYSSIKAGIINWNHPLTGASSKAPFGGIGRSGNFRPSAYLAADYCSYPVASMQSNHLTRI